MSLVLDAQQLTLARGARTLISMLDLKLERGQTLALLGPNGAGKSTLLETLAGLYEPASGRVLLEARSYRSLGPAEAARRRAWLPQHAQHSDGLGGNVLEAALAGRYPHLSRFARESDEDLRHAREALAAVGLAELAERPVQALSGGQRQRLYIATRLTQNAPLMLLDEPLAHLDLGAHVPLLGMLCERAAQGALVLSLHEPTLARRFCQLALLMFDDGQHLLGPAQEVINADTLTRLHRHPFRELQDGPRRVYVPA